MRIPLTSFFLLVSLIIPRFSQAGFDLFDPERGKDKIAAAAAAAANKPTAPAAIQPPAPPPKPLLPQKDFLLKGTSKIGNKVSVILQGLDGKDVMVKIDKSGRTPIPNSPGYTIIGVEPRQLKIEYPQDAPCRTTDRAKGVVCQGEGRIALLKLERRGAIAAPPPAAPVAAPPPIFAGAPPAPNNPFAAAVNQQGVQNPFANLPQRPLTPEEQKKQEEELKQRQELYKNFQRQVIKDEDVPPGMRVVRTPFGDRLVPDNK